MTLDRYDMLFYICKYILLYINYYIATTVIYFTITYRAGAGAPTKVPAKAKSDVGLMQKLRK